MGEGHLQKFVRAVQVRLTGWLVVLVILLATGQWLLQAVVGLDDLVALAITVALGLIFAVLTGFLLGKTLTRPTEYVAQAILHISPSEHLVAAPNIDELKFGHELADSLVRQVYGFATMANNATAKTEKTITPNALIEQLPIAVIGLDEKNIVVLSNGKTTSTLKTENIKGQQFKDTLQMLTEDETGIETWIEAARQQSLTESKTWQKVEIKSLDGTSLGYFDIAVSFNKHSSSGVEVVMAFYDHSEAYEQEESSFSLVALAVHELRTPLTIMRGYLEAFGDEIGSDKMTPQLTDDLRKMSASAESMASFISNVLNVARINHGELSLALAEDNWNKALPQIVDSLRNRAAVHGKELELRMQPGLPTVAIDRTTIAEVITNLIDNAIKYSPDNAPKIMIVSKLNSDGAIETTVIDKGIGIPSSVMPNLFSKYYRNHRTRSTVRGTGLGLFLSKAVVTAHHGNIWASSKEGEGSTFGFTLMPYSQLAKDLKSNNNGAIVRGSHGWIKNHSMQRR